MEPDETTTIGTVPRIEDHTIGVRWQEYEHRGEKFYRVDLIGTNIELCKIVVGDSLPVNKADVIKRIIACVNFLRTIPTEQLYKIERNNVTIVALLRSWLATTDDTGMAMLLDEMQDYLNNPREYLSRDAMFDFIKDIANGPTWSNVGGTVNIRATIRKARRLLNYPKCPLCEGIGYYVENPETTVQHTKGCVRCGQTGYIIPE